MSSPSMCPYLLISYMLSHIFPDHFYVAAMCDLSAFARGTVTPFLTCCFLFTQEVTRLSIVKQPLNCSNLDDIELLRLADARDRVKANQAVIQDSPGHLQSILAQSQLKLAGSVEGHQLTFKLKAILKSKQYWCGLQWFNGSYQLDAHPVKSVGRTDWWTGYSDECDNCILCLCGYRSTPRSWCPPGFADEKYRL